MGRIVEYLAVHRERFDLRHPATPFFQVAELRTSTGGVSELTRLIADVPNGNPFFTTRLGRGLADLSAAEAARWVVHCQAFDPSGIKSGAVGDPRVKGGKGYPIGVAWSGLLGGVFVEGASLRRTLLLNLVGTNFRSAEDRSSTDLPAWERQPDGPTENVEGGRSPDGLLDLYTWQSRRLRLAWTHDRVTGVLVCNGEKVLPQNRHSTEPLTAWRRSETQEKKLRLDTVYMPREHDPDRAIWRGLQSLLPGIAGRGGPGVPAGLAPLVLEWISDLREEGCLGADDAVRVRAIGMVYGSNSSVIDEIIDDAVAMRIELLRAESPQLAQIAVVSATAAESAARAVGDLAGDLAAAAGGDGAGARSRAREGAFAELDSPFRQWLADLRTGQDPTQVQIDWQTAAHHIVSKLGGELLARSPMAAWVGREVRSRLSTTAHADIRFRRSLRAALPLAYANGNAGSSVSTALPPGQTGASAR